MYANIIDMWKQSNPVATHQLGIHEYDGEFPRLNPDQIENRIKQINEDLKYLRNNPPSDDRLSQFEHQLVQSQLETELFSLDERKEFTTNPVTWIYPLSLPEVSYTTRSFASLDDRIKLITKFEQNIPEWIDLAYHHLEDSLPKPKVKMALQFLPGILSFYKDRLLAFIIKTDEEELIDRWSEINIIAVEKLEEFHDKLLNYYLPNSHPNFALGKTKFMKLLKMTEGVDIDYKTLLQVGMDDLEKNYKSLLEIGDTMGGLDKYLRKIRSHYPDPSNLVEAAEETLERSKQFLIDNDIVSLPTEKQCQVIETPQFARKFGFAAMNTPGPFEVEKASEAYYWITPPDPAWSTERINQFMTFFSRSFLEIVTVHEVWPGHYLQLLYNKLSKSDISKMFARSITMIEGWGHYTEQMIFDEGYSVPNISHNELHVGQLFGALVRNCRYVAALKMHCEDWTVEQAKKLFMEKAFMPEPTAEIEANRGTIDPMYLNYTLGKLMILKLRDDYKREQGDNYSLKEFHDTLLSYGSPPISVLRNILLDNNVEDIL